MLSNKVKTPNTSPVKEGFKIKPVRATISLLMAGAISVTSFMAGRCSIDQEKDPVSDDDKDAGADNQLSLKDKIDTINGARDSVLQWDDEPEDTEVCRLEDMDPDEIIDESQDIMDERNEKLANQLIAKLGITNENDKQGIIDAFLDGCTEVESVGEQYISFSDPNDENRYCEHDVEFEEPIEVPEELKDDNPETLHETEVEFDRLGESGDYAGALESVDYNKVLNELSELGIDDGLFLDQIELRRKLTDEALNGQDPERIKQLACMYVLNMMLSYEYMTDSGDSFAKIIDNPLLKSFFGSEMSFGFFAAMMGMAGASEHDLEEDIMEQCIVDALKANQDCMFN